MTSRLLISRPLITASILMVLGLGLRFPGLGLVFFDRKVYLIGSHDDAIAAWIFPRKHTLTGVNASSADTPSV